MHYIYIRNQTKTFKDMAIINTSEVLKSAHKSAKSLWKESKKGTWNKNWSYGKTYRQVFAVCLKNSWADAKINAEEVETFVVYLGYEEVSKRNTVKSLGGKWNPDSKSWTVSCRKSQLGSLSENISAKSKINHSGKTEWLINGNKTIYNNLSYGEMWNRYGTNFE